MKLKILSVMILTLAMSIPLANNAEAEVPTGFGVGYQGMFLGNLLNGASGRYWMSENMGFEMDLFHLYTDINLPAGAGVAATHAHVIDFMEKVLYAPIVKENSRFYVGAQVGYGVLIIKGDGNDTNMITAGPLMGAEYHFQGLPELGFNFEVGYLWNYVFQGVDPADTDVHLLGINVALGVHYYF